MVEIFQEIVQEIEALPLFFQMVLAVLVGGIIFSLIKRVFKFAIYLVIALLLILAVLYFL